ncbi:LOW QUALITY PROTEIN: exosome complex component RRP46-like [Haliotis rubra]|uniref:LOW QUALITY PROTEIN: exosome complex component RRP46-like n=1 Tax=Haliotis rubra TaxID=36100 RepID=UPI001EE5BDCA|nr:LOW QUALITY PROTEIN: exosome complex component RRP46-like [Haliotis rubra]
MQEGSIMTDLRPMTSDLGVLTRPDGTVTFTQGDTGILAAVYGPGEVKIAREILDRATVEVIYKPKSGLPGCSERLHERYIRNTVETAILASLHPRSCISVTVQELQNSGSLLACSVNAACLALLDACVNMKYLIAGVHVIIDGDGNTILDPDVKQEGEKVAGVTFVLENQNHSVVTMSSRGSLTTEQFHRCLLHAQAAAKQIFSFYRIAVEKKMSKP